MLVGRNDEIGQINRLVAAARESAGSSLILHGDPGIGKTALLDHVVTFCSGFAILRAQPLQVESELAFAGLADLLRPLVHLVDQLPVPQASALSGALALGPATPGDRFAAAVGTMSLLAAAAEHEPILAIVDDAHWLDRPSREALLFAARRMTVERVVLLLATRWRSWLVETHIEMLEVQPLSARAANQLLKRSDRVVSPAVRRQLVEDAQGNPLALRETLSTLSDAELRGAASLNAPGNTASDLSRAFADQLTALPERTRRALLIAASSISGDAEEVARGLELAGLRQADLGPAATSGVISEGAGTLSFRHPLLRSAVSDLADPAEIRHAHRIMADAVTAQRTDQVAWHLAGAANGPDETAARALEGAAEDAQQRHGYAAAATALSVAARLSPTDTEHLRRAMLAANAFRLAGHPQEAADALASCSTLAVDPSRRADVQQMLGPALASIRPVMEVVALLRDEAELVESVDSARAGHLFAMASVFAIGAAEIGLALDTANRAVACAGPNPAVAFLGQIARAFALTAAGRVDDGRVALRPLLPVLETFDPLSEAGVILPFAAHMLSWSQDWPGAIRIVERIVSTAREASALTVLPHPLAVLSELQLRRGHVAAAYAAGAESVQIARETGLEVESTFCLTTLARVEALLGRDDDCRAHVRIALEVAARFGMVAAENYGHAALGMLDLSRGRPDPAVAHLTESARLERVNGMGLPDAVLWNGDLIEAYLLLGTTQSATSQLQVLEDQARNTGSLWAAATAARYRAVMASDDEYESSFANALELHEEREPFEVARTLLCLGRRRRRSRRRTAAIPALRDALVQFESLQAEPWAEQTRIELRAIGDDPRPIVSAPVAALTVLTAQELQIALIVAEGATNAEVGWKLFISPKTVEFHLSHVYRKLRLRSRTELAHKLGETT